MSNIPSQFVIDWLNRLEVQHAQNIEYHREILRGYIMNDMYPTIADNSMNNLNGGGNNTNRDNNVGVVEVVDNVSIITVSDDEPVIITGDDVFLDAASVIEQSGENSEREMNENRGEQSGENSERERSENRDGQSNENGENHIQNDLGYATSDSDNENVLDPIINRTRNAAMIAANIIQQIIENENNIDADYPDSDADTEPFDYEEYLNQPPRNLLVDYSDSDSDDSYFEKYDKSNKLLQATHSICTPCQDQLINKQPYMIIPCRHFICVKCIKTIFKMDRRYWNCPNCRQFIESKSQCTRVYL